MFDSVGAVHDVEGREGRLGAGLVAVIAGVALATALLTQLVTEPVGSLETIDTLLPVLTMAEDIPPLDRAPDPPAGGGAGGDPVATVATTTPTAPPDPTQPVDDPVLPPPDRIAQLPADLARALTTGSEPHAGGSGPGKGAGPPGLGPGGSGGGDGIRVEGSQLRWRKRSPEPVYPAAAHRAPGAVDLCMADLSIDAAGHVVDVDVAGCDPLFHDAVRHALMRWRTWPHRSSGSPQPVRARVAIRFRQVAR